METQEENTTKKSDGDECILCKGELRAVICSCEVAPKYDPDYEEWRNK